MGWTTSISAVLGKFTRKEPVIEAIPLNGLQEWISLRASELISKTDIDKELHRYVRNLKDERWFLETRMDGWESKVRLIHNPVKNDEVFVFFSQTRKLLEFLTFAQKITVERMLALNKIIEKKVENLMRELEKSSFADEFSFIFIESGRGAEEVIINPLLQALIKINGLRQEFQQKITNSGYGLIESLLQNLKIIEETTLTINKLRDGIKDRRERLTVAMAKKVEKEEELKEKKVNPHYHSLWQKTEEKRMLREEKKKYESQILDFFTSLTPALGQYLRIQGENSLVSSYLERPLHAFMKDEGLTIKHILRHLRAVLKAGKLGLSLKDELCVEEILQFMSEDKLQELSEQNINLQRKIDSFKVEPVGKDLIYKVEEAEYRFTHFVTQVDKLQADVAHLIGLLKEHEDVRSKEQYSLQKSVRDHLSQNIHVVVD